MAFIKGAPREYFDLLFGLFHGCFGQGHEFLIAGSLPYYILWLANELLPENWGFFFM